MPGRPRMKLKKIDKLTMTAAMLVHRLSEGAPAQYQGADANLLGAITVLDTWEHKADWMLLAGLRSGARLLAEGGPDALTPDHIKIPCPKQRSWQAVLKLSIALAVELEELGATMRRHLGITTPEPSLFPDLDAEQGPERGQTASDDFLPMTTPPSCRNTVIMQPES